MRQKIWPLLCLVLVVTCAVLLVLWQGEKNSAPEVDELWLYSMTQAHTRFSEYLSSHNEGDYWYGAAEFQTMVNCAMAADRAGKTDANAVAGALMYDPEQARSHLEEICGTLETCIADPGNTAQWEIAMNELRHLLEHSET